MNITVEWSEPYSLRDGSDRYLIYACDDLDSFPREPGVYIFARRYGNTVCPLYIGQTLNIYKRIVQHFKFSLVLMNKIKKKAKAGDRIVLFGIPKLAPGQQVERVLQVLEHALIGNALAQGHELLNVHGTNIPAHYITNRGNPTSRSM
ncbi:MAG: GIY-YIG nuclease family protein, partial [Terriglobia bacterium]